MAAGASLVRNGENGKGVASRWYPETLVRRIRQIVTMADKIDFVQQDAIELIDRYANRSTAAFFVDPPYTAGGKRAGKRLYRHNEIDHETLFGSSAEVKGAVLMTYDDATEVRELARRHELHIEAVPMKNTHHRVMHELAISNTGTCVPAGAGYRLAQATTRTPSTQTKKPVDCVPGSLF